MPAASKDDPQPEVDRADAELARTKKVQEDLWSHDIYLNARRKITTGVVAVLTIVGLASGSALWSKFTEISDRLEKYAQDEMENNLAIKVNAAIDKMIKDEIPEIMKKNKYGN